MHARIVQKELSRFDDVICDFVAVDRLHSTPLMSWGNTADTSHPILPSSDTVQSVDIRHLDAIWWRRSPFTQSIVKKTYTDANHKELINNDCAAAVIGLTEIAFRGVWVSAPLSTWRAENKIVQLHTAQACGLRVPRTLVTQNEEALSGFIKTIDGPVVVKALRGPSHMGVPTSLFLPEHLSYVDAIRAAPAIYQEYVPGTLHLRIHCFGKHILTASIDSDALDWRGDLSVPFKSFDLPDEIKDKLLLLLKKLELRMGIFDMKLCPKGEYNWIEVNPQGQFLFVEALAQELELTNAFARFLRKEAIFGRRMKMINRQTD